MYPVTFIPIWATIVGVIVAIGLSYWVAKKDDSPRPIGFGAVFISLVTASCWMTNLPGWTAVVVIVATLGLFIAGMLVSESIDDWFHYGAMIVAVFGKLVAALLPLMWAVLTGTVKVPVIVLVLLAIAVGIAFWVGRSHRQQIGAMLNRMNPAA